MDPLPNQQGTHPRVRRSSIHKKLREATSGYAALANDQHSSHSNVRARSHFRTELMHSPDSRSADILAFNGGSSSIKFAWYRRAASNRLKLERRLAGKIERIGTKGATLTVQGAAGDPPATSSRQSVQAGDYATAATSLLAWLEAQPEFSAVGAVGHRIVHGLRHMQPERITASLLDELRSNEASDPDHLPGEIHLIELLRERHPAIVGVACYDTAFHRDMPRVAQLLPIPRRYFEQGVRRYGFHGLSFSYLMYELGRAAGPDAQAGRVVLAHLGNGVSVAAVQNGQSIDTTMGFTPTSGLPMGTRSGDLDPGLAPYLAETEQMSAERFHEMTNHESGLLGVSETSADMRDLLAHEGDDLRAADAVALFCYQLRKCVGAYAAALGGIDTLIFTGGIGENAAPVRERICEGLGFLGIAIDTARNAAHADVISTAASQATVRVMRTDEELMIATSVARLLDTGI